MQCLIILSQALKNVFKNLPEIHGKALTRTSPQGSLNREWVSTIFHPANRPIDFWIILLIR